MIRASLEHGLSWAVAGRSEGKLHAVLDKAGKAVGADLSSTAIIVSELFNPSSHFPAISTFRLRTPLTARHYWGWLLRPRWCSTVLDLTGEIPRNHSLLEFNRKPKVFWRASG